MVVTVILMVFMLENGVTMYIKVLKHPPSVCVCAAFVPYILPRRVFYAYVPMQLSLCCLGALCSPTESVVCVCSCAELAHARVFNT